MPAHTRYLQCLLSKASCVEPFPIRKGFARMAKSASSSGLFVRQASGLVRDVSMTNALFFNIAAFVGTAVGWAVVFYALFPEWQGLGISAYAWMAILTGIACYFLGMIFASLTTAMPRSGGAHGFTSRILLPFWG